MKRLFSIFVLFVMLGYSFMQIGTFMEYIVDIESYTEKYCVNKDTPEKQCRGKCHLTEQLAQNEKEQQKNNQQAPPEILLSPIVIAFEIQKQISPKNKEIEFFYLSLILEEPHYSIFQPPKI